jgi:hypothetical protein
LGTSEKTKLLIPFCLFEFLIPSGDIRFRKIVLQNQRLTATNRPFDAVPGTPPFAVQRRGIFSPPDRHQAIPETVDPLAAGRCPHSKPEAANTLIRRSRIEFWVARRWPRAAAGAILAA